MGDVFDALNRAKQERGEPQRPADGSGDQDANGASESKPEEGGGLAYDDVETRPLSQEPQRSQPASAPHGEDDAEGGPDAAAPRDDASDGAAPPPPPSRSRRSPVADAADRAAADEIENRLDLEIREVPANRDGAKLNGYSAEMVVHHDRGSAVTEQYRAIRTQLLARSRNRTVQTTVLTSSTPEEGKSVTTANLGISFSELRNKKTLLVEGDLRRPSFSKLFDRECTPGLLHLLRGEVDSLEEVVHPTIYDNLQFIPAGGRDSTHSTELLSSPRMVQVLEQLKDRYDHIFIDSPPVITVTDSCILGAMADQVLLVVRLNKTPSNAVERAKRLLRASNCEVSGVILTHMKHYISRYLYKYSYGYGYGYGYGYTASK